MKCTNCGFPLSPNNTDKHCHRCHTTLVRDSKSASLHASQQYDSQVRVGQNGPQLSSSPAWTMSSPESNLPLPPVVQTPFPQPGQMWQPDPTSPPLPSPLPMEVAVRNSGAFHSLPKHTTSAVFSTPSRAIRLGSPRPPTTRKRQSGNFGFMLAGLCVIAGGLILVFVYFAAMGLPPTGTTNASMGTPAATRNAFPSPTAAPPSPTVVPSPTVDTYPGQQYIDNAQMASVVNTTTAQPLQTTTIFKINRRIYVTFSIHPDGKNGAVCLFWYLNNRNIAQYPFEVTAGAKAAYSYATYGGPGTAYVDIYWASTTACSDKILAQHVNFTVTK